MNTQTDNLPAATIRERPDGYDLKIVVPGIAKEDIELHLNGRTLSLKTRSQHQPPAGFRAVSTEFKRTNYAMSCDLPEMADPATLSAKLENGILIVSIGKRPETQAKKIEIA